MSEIFFTVGPTQLYPTVKNHIKNALDENIFSISHTGNTFQKYHSDLKSNLRQIYKIPESFHIFLIPSSTESMERIISNTVATHSMHIVSGAFGQKFCSTARELKKQTTIVNVPKDQIFEYENINIGLEIELVCVTENETSIGYRTPLTAFKLLKKKSPHTLFAIDVVSSAPYSEIDFSVFDIVFFSVQKGMGLPAGLAVLIVNDSAIEKAKFLEKKDLILGAKHHSFINFYERSLKNILPGTPNVFDIYLLSMVTQDMIVEGIENIRTRLEFQAERIYNYFDNHKVFNPFIIEKYRSITTPVIATKSMTKKVLDELSRTGIYLSRGYKPFEEVHIRIANFPAHQHQDIERLLNSFQEITDRL